MTNIQLPVTHEDIQRNHNEFLNNLREAMEAQADLDKYEERIAEIWEELNRDPDFKPGRSNADKLAKIRVVDPDLVMLYLEAVSSLAAAKGRTEMSRNRISQLSMHIRLAETLVRIADLPNLEE